MKKSATRVVVSYPHTRGVHDPSPFVDNSITNTKYTPLTFIPLNLWQQFGANMNRYFLLIACLQLWSLITPVAPITTWGPLIVIFTISGVKEALDDVKRYRSDRAANERLVCVLRDGRRQWIQSQHLLVGDLVRVEEQDELPADMVLLSSSETKQGSCYIQTSNIDGETNLKTRYTAQRDHLQPLSELELMQTNIMVECAQPNNLIYDFASTLRVSPKPDAPPSSTTASPPQQPDEDGLLTFPLSGDNLLLQATYLRNTEWVIGLVVYTGNETKVGCNKQPPQVKTTKLDQAIDRVTAFVFALQLLLILIWGAIGYSHQEEHIRASKDHVRDGSEPNAWYLDYEHEVSHLSAIIIPLRFLLLASMMIPISLKVSLDIIKLYAAAMIGWDAKLADPNTGQPAKATSTSLAENLGQVSYVLSDKTGTLTQNVMVFTKMTVKGGKRYGDASEQEEPKSQVDVDEDGAQRSRGTSSALASSSDSSAAVSADILLDRQLRSDLQSRDPELLRMLRVMALCNTVVPSYAQSKGGWSDGAGTEARSRPVVVPVPPSGLTSSLSPEKRILGRKGSDVVGGGENELEMVGSSTSVSPLSKHPSMLVPINDSSALAEVEEGRPRSIDRVRSSLLHDGWNGGHGLPPSDSLSYFGPASETLQSSGEREPLSPSASFQTSLVRQSTNRLLPSSSHGQQEVHYASSSPDELSLVEFAAQVGVRLLEKNGNIIKIQVDPAGSTKVSTGEDSTADCIEYWELLHVLEFSSERKRMSVIIRQMTRDNAGSVHPSGRILLLCKGADDVILARLAQSKPGSDGSDESEGSSVASSNASNVPHFRHALDSYASTGLRTLCFAWREIDVDEYASWSKSISEAQLDILQRDASLAATYELIERDMEMIGATGIEDQLQPDVGEAIATLREAGCKVWLLTGDKFQTALEISKSCELYKPLRESTSGAVGASAGAGAGVGTDTDGDALYQIEGDTPEAIDACLDSIHLRALNMNNEAAHKFCIIVDGQTLSGVLSPQFESRFAMLALQATSVICCRTTPSQKAAMVKLVRNYSKNMPPPQATADVDDYGLAPHERNRNEHQRSRWTSNNGNKWDIMPSAGKVVCAIGDGGNDVSMIQVADVGCGIIGREGLQAARAADYAFSTFSCLPRLLLVHGRWSYERTAKIASYCYYKSMLICLVQLFFAYVSDWSGASFFDSFALTCYNLFYTSVPVLLFMLDRPLSGRMLESNPKLYATSQRGDDFNVRTLVGWFIRAILQAAILTLYAFHAQHGAVTSEALGSENQLSNALVIYTSCVLIHPLTIYLESHTITLIHHIILWGTLVLFIVLNALLAALTPAMDLWHIYFLVLSDGEYYLRTMCLTAACILPVAAWRAYEQRWLPSVVQRAREADLASQRMVAPALGLPLAGSSHSTRGGKPKSAM